MNPDPLWRQAETYASHHEWERAIACFKALHERMPDEPRVLVRLSHIESLAGHYRSARDYALRACQLRPHDPATARELASRLRTFNEAQALNNYVTALGPIGRMPIPLLLTCAAQYTYLNQPSLALRLLDEAKQADPDYPPTLLARGQALVYLGRFEEAKVDVTRCLRRAPELAQGWWLLSNLEKQTPNSNHVDAISVQLQRANRNPEDVALLAFALHKQLDDLGDVDGAWMALERACKAKRSTLRYQAEESRRLMDALIQLPIGHAPPTSQASGKTPIFIVGMHRTGTTLLEQLLDGHPEVQAIGEQYDFTSAMRLATDHHCRGVIDLTLVQRSEGLDFAEVGSRYMSGLAWRLGPQSHFTDKLPSNFLNLGFICRALPHAKILHMVRDPLETCFSNLRELFSGANPYSYDQLELADYFIQYRRVMAHWHASFPGRILDVDYARLTADPKQAMHEVAAFCGLEYVDAMSDTRGSKRAVATASALQVREGVSRRETPKWAPYAAHLQPLVDALSGWKVRA
jgi:tetratricopeptide (TPR) repeat protein